MNVLINVCKSRQTDRQTNRRTSISCIDPIFGSGDLIIKVTRCIDDIDQRNAVQPFKTHIKTA